MTTVQWGGTDMLDGQATLLSTQNNVHVRAVVLDTSLSMHPNGL